MKIYRVKVNGKLYEVQIESITEAPVPVLKQPIDKPLAGGENIIKAPMQGTIIDIKVQPGQQVRRGDILIVLEAMKLENNIVASAPGVIKDIFVLKGEAVINQQPLLTLDSL